MFSFRAILPEPPSVHIVDLGAMALDGWAPPYQSLLDAGLARVTGFEPVAEECRELNRNAKAGHRYLPCAVGDGRVRTFRRCNEAMTSSLYEPNTLRARGFCFHRFLGFAGRAFKPVVINRDVNAMIRQMLWADAVYVHDWMKWANLSAAELAKLSLILHEVYRSYDLVPVALDHYDRQTGAGARRRYLRLLGSPE